MENQEIRKCRRCNRPAKADQICQNCKNELLANYEASSDWQTAFEIERAQMLAFRYQLNDNENEDWLKLE